MDLAAVLFLGLVLGLVLGYWSAMPRVKRLESALVLKSGWELDSHLAQERSLASLKAKELE